MQGDRDDMLALSQRAAPAKVQHQRAQQRNRAEVMPRVPGLRLDAPPRLLFAAPARQGAQIDERSLDLDIRRHFLRGRAVAIDDPRPQYLVPPHDLPQTITEHINVKITHKTKNRGDVVGTVLPGDLMQNRRRCCA